MKGLHLILGPMFSGKTSKVISFVQENKAKVAAFKPAIDTRYKKEAITSHDGVSVNAIVVHKGDEVYEKAKGKDLLVIDEVQFFDNSLLDAVEALLNEGKFILVSGLNKDYKSKPFTIVEALKKMAMKVTNLESTCIVCGEAAEFTYKISNVESEGQVLVCGAEMYEPRCATCYRQ